jgi:multimeric flavodoxin WrbA
MKAKECRQMKIIAVNGSPRKKWNTATLLTKALEGAASKGAETKLFHLYDLDFKGCISCFSCKKRGGKSYGACAVQDDVTPIYAEIKEASALILGSPIYFGDVTGEMRSFLERLLFPYLVYANPPRTLFLGKLKTAWIYTMNAPEEDALKRGYGRLFESNENLMRLIFGHSESIMSYDTYQFKDYSKFVADRFDAAAKERRRNEIFPSDCQKAFELGVSLS